MYSAVNRSAVPSPRLPARQLSTGKSLTPLFLLAILFSLMASAVISSRVYAQTTPDISGTWRGTLIAGQSDPIEIIFHIIGDAGSYTATLDIPAQSRTGLPVESVSLNGSNLTIRMDSLQAEYYASLVMVDDGSAVDALNGDWGQSGEHIPLRMQRDRL